MSIDAYRQPGTFQHDPIYRLPDGSFGREPIRFLPLPSPRVPGQGATAQDMIDALARRGITGVSHQTAFFLLQVYGGQEPRALGVTTDEVIAGMLSDGSLTNAGGITTQLRLNFAAIDGKRIAAAIFREAGIDPDNPGLVLNPHLLDFGIDILTGNPHGHSEAQAEMQIRKFGVVLINGSGGITVHQLAEMIESGELRFSPADRQPFIGITCLTDRQHYGIGGREAPYLLSFDTNVDGGLDWQELQTALQSNLYENQVIDPKMAQMLWHFYGTSVNGSWLITADGIAAMKADGVLKNWANTDGSAGFAIHLAAINPDLFADGLLRYDRDGSGDLNPEELTEALTPYADASGRVDPEITRRLGILYGGRNGIERDGLKQMLAEGVLVPAVGAAGAETAGFRINLDAIPTERVVDRMFLYLGKDPATATMTTEEFERAIDFVTGDENPINGDVAAYIGAMRGVPDGAGGHTLNRAQVLSVFTSGAITRKSEPGLSIIPIQNNVNHEVPKHHHHHWWDSVFKFFKDEAKDLVDTLADITGIAAHVLADIFNGKMSIQDALAHGGGQIVDALIAAYHRGDERFHTVIDKLSEALKSELHTLGAEGHALIDKLVHAAKHAGEEMAIKTLMALSGMKPEEAHKALTSMASKNSLFDFAKGLSFEDIKSMVPNFDATVAELEDAADKYMSEAPNDPVARRKLMDAGYSFNADNQLLKGARVLSVEDKRDVFAKYFRADAAIELNLGHSQGIMFNGLQFRVFLAYRGTDKAGNKVMELRFRILDEAGVAGGDKTKGRDAGLISVHDLVLSWSFSPDGTTTFGDVVWNSTLGVVGETNNGAAGLAAYLQTKITGVPVDPPDSWNRLDTERGVGWGMTVSYNLTKLKDGWYHPMLAELVGGLVGAGLTSAALFGITEVAPEFVEKYGLTLENAGLMVGAFAADLAFAGLNKHDDQVSVSNGFFAWVAVPRVGFDPFDIRTGSDQSSASGQFRFRLQINVGNNPWTMY